MRRGARMLLVAGFACGAAWLLPSASALAFSEEVSGGTTTLALELPKKIASSATAPATANGSSIVFQNTGGVVDAARGTARIDLAGGLTLSARKRGKVDIAGLKYNASASGIVNATVRGEQMAFADVAGAVQAGSLEATVNGAPALLTAEAAKALNRVLGKKKKKKGKGKAAASKKKKFKKIFREGDRIGAVSTAAAIRTIAVRAQGNAELVPDPSSVTTFFGKGVNAIPGFGGITPVAPASTSGPIGENFTFPITGGRIAPDFSAGQLATAGGLRIQKNMNNSSQCMSVKPQGIFIQQTDLTIDFDRRVLLSTIDSSGGFVGNGVISADLAFSGATLSVSPSGQISIENLGVALNQSSATTLNGLFGTEAQGCGADFQGGDPLGHLNVTGQLG